MTKVHLLTFMLTLGLMVVAPERYRGRAASAGEDHIVNQGLIYREPGRFAGWPANHGMWCWGDEIVLRSDGGGRDMGYPRSLQTANGNVVTTYYFWDKKAGPERYIAATVWDPRKVP